jgi:predicted dehydrogenase
MAASKKSSKSNSAPAKSSPRTRASKRGPLGIGVLGTGWVAGAHIENFKKIDGCEIVAVCSRSLDRAQAKITQHNLIGTKAYDDYDAMLETEGLDVVVICTPHPGHPSETIAAAEAGKHIVIEKPVAMDRKSLARMLAAVEKAGVQTSVCFELRWIGLFQNIKAMLGQGLLGNLFYGETAYFHGIGPWYGQYPWNRLKEMGGDAFLTAGCHALDGLIWLMDSEVVEVSAMSNTSPKNPLKYEYDTNICAILRFASGAIGKVSTSIECRQPYTFPVILQGDKGTIDGDKLSSTSWPGTTPGQWARIPTAMPDSGDVDDHPYLGQLEYFVECIRKDKRPHNDLRACSHVHEVMFAIQQAIAKKKTIEVPRTPGS